MSKYTVVIIGNRGSCSLCRGLSTSFVENGALTKALPGATLVDADQRDNPALNREWKAKCAAVRAWPVIAVFDGAKRVGQFVCRASASAASSAEKWVAVRPWSAAGIAAKIASYCPGCVEAGVPDVPDTPDTCADECPKCGFEFKFCPNCGAEACAD